MTASTSSDSNNTIGPFGHRFLGKCVVNNIVQHYASV